MALWLSLGGVVVGLVLTGRVLWLAHPARDRVLAQREQRGIPLWQVGAVRAAKILAAVMVRTAWTAGVAWRAVRGRDDRRQLPPGGKMPGDTP